MSRSPADYWTGKSVLITGASSGIGSALVEALAPYRIHFCLLSRRQAPMNELAAKLISTGSRFWIRACDVRNRTEVESAIEDFVKIAGRLDAAWINSGIGGETSFRNWDWNLVESIIDTNFKGALYTAHTCLRFMVTQNSGTLVAISSAAAMRGLGARAVYSAGKIALAYYMDSLAAELPQIQFTTIYPGFVDTPINRNSPNRFWVMTPEKATQLMIKAVAKGKKELIYPFRMNLLFKLIRALPVSWYRWIAHRQIEAGRPHNPTPNSER